jgi:sulfur relay (sulfurtransferase) DsrC/TusE family protein
MLIVMKSDNSGWRLAILAVFLDPAFLPSLELLFLWLRYKNEMSEHQVHVRMAAIPLIQIRTSHYEVIGFRQSWYEQYYFTSPCFRQYHLLCGNAGLVSGNRTYNEETTHSYRHFKWSQCNPEAHTSFSESDVLNRILHVWKSKFCNVSAPGPV